DCPQGSRPPFDLSFLTPQAQQIIDFFGENVIVVTVNYRLNIFGFPGAPDNVDNLGFRDQRFAGEWVRDNIAAFGGDASKITIFGQSSGGVAVDYWAFAYTEDPIVSGLISHSGNALSFPMNPENVTLSNCTLERY
ncbi:hypothetical protein KC330_g9270, partial [Hortaea werneckii]